MPCLPAFGGLFLTSLGLLGVSSTLAESQEPPASQTTLQDRIRGALLGSLVADALCLGSHYEYDAKVIKKAYGGKEIETYMAPGEKMGGTTHGVGWGRRNYHPGQKKGDQTDYGEYNLLMLEYLAGAGEGSEENGSNKNGGPINLGKLIPVWQKRLETNWGAWVCTQSKQALQRVKGIKKMDARAVASLGGHSNAMSLRSAAVFGVCADEEDAARASSQLMFTHANSDALLGGEFFTRVAHRIVFQSLTPEKALEDVCADMGAKHQFVAQQCKKGFSKFKEATDPSQPLGKVSSDEFQDDLAMTSMARLWNVGKTEPIKVGKASPTEGTMPSSIYMILKYSEHSKNPLEAASKANAMVGGDNAARAVAIGMVLGAYQGAGAIPADLKTGLRAWKKASRLLGKLPLVSEREKEKEKDEL